MNGSLRHAGTLLKLLNNAKVRPRPRIGIPRISSLSFGAGLWPFSSTVTYHSNRGPKLVNVARFLAMFGKLRLFLCERVLSNNGPERFVPSNFWRVDKVGSRQLIVAVGTLNANG